LFYSRLKNITNIFFDLYGVLIDYKFEKIIILPTVDLLEKLNQNYSLSIISNISNQQLNFLKNKLNFLHYFDNIITSESAQYSKPDYRIFNYALNYSNTNSSSSLFIDDSYSNIKSAKELGFLTFHYIDYDSLNNFLQIDE
tara:strand:+ start:64 stop:486 length:423 start_codon:yes stop_codon:yes gene_type:complete